MTAQIIAFPRQSKAPHHEVIPFSAAHAILMGHAWWAACLQAMLGDMPAEVPASEAFKIKL